jgi:drug/metabolite transporter (DMT)-like permease
MMLAGAVAIGFAPIGLRLSEFGPQATAFWRFAFALPLLAALIFATGGRIRAPGPFSLLAGLFFGLDIAFWHEALVETSVANATFLVNLGNASVGLIAWIVLKEKPARIWPLAIGVALLGALLLSRGADPDGASALFGDLLALVAAAMVALYLFFAKLARRTEVALNVLFWATVVELVVAAGATGVTGEALLPPDPAWLLAPLFLAVVAHVMGQGLIVAGIGRTPAAIAGLLLLVQPVTGALIAWPLFGETLAPLQMAGAALVLVGVWLAGRR